MRNYPLFVPAVKLLFLLVISMFTFVAISGYVQYRDLLTVIVGTIDVMILTGLAIWAWGGQQ